MFNVMRIDRKEERNIRTLKYDHLQFNYSGLKLGA